MNRLTILTSTLLFVVFSGLNVTFAQQRQGRTLHDAAVAGDVNEVKSLLAKGEDINERNRMGGTPLQTAIMNRQKAIAELLIARGADVNARDNHGQTPLSEAVKTGDKDIVEMLITKKADVNAAAGPGENALSLARKTGHTEIAELLVKNGAKEPSLQTMEGEMYGRQPGAAGSAGLQGQVPRRGPAGAVGQPADKVKVDVLADPNEIKARIKTFAGLAEALKEVADKSQNEVRQWEPKRYDNRMYLARAVQLQFEDEMAVIRKAAVDEKAKKTTEAIDALLSSRKKRSDAVYKGLLEQRRQSRQTQTTTRFGRGRTRGRTMGRNMNVRGRAETGPYGTETPGTPYEAQGAAPERSRPQDQQDQQTQDEIRQWTQATADKKDDLAKSVHEQIMGELSSIRVVAVEEKAKKTVATIDGVLLARQQRFDQVVQKMQEEEKALQQQAQNPRTLGRSAGRYAPGAGMQQNQRRTRGRRR
jgi:Ankyrin repeats (3 copies)/Ankyrin repeat